MGMICIYQFKTANLAKHFAPGEDRTHDLQITLDHDYETDALPTALPRLMDIKYLLINYS